MTNNSKITISLITLTKIFQMPSMVLTETFLTVLFSRLLMISCYFKQFRNRHVYDGLNSLTAIIIDNDIRRIDIIKNIKNPYCRF